jgi:hypothetical protein
MHDASWRATRLGTKGAGMDSDLLRVGVIVASVRQGRRGEGIARWFLGILGARPEIEARLLDLKEYRLPDYEAATGARMAEGKYTLDAQQRWALAVAGLDGYVIVTPEYNHGKRRRSRRRCRSRRRSVRDGQSCGTNHASATPGSDAANASAKNKG